MDNNSLRVKHSEFNVFRRWTCVDYLPLLCWKLDIVINVERRIGPANRENVSCDIDYCVSLSLVIDICLLHFLYIFHYGKMEFWRRREFRSSDSMCSWRGRRDEDSVHVARKTKITCSCRRTLTLDTRRFRKGLNSVICNLLLLYVLCDVKIVIFSFVQKL